MSNSSSSNANGPRETVDSLRHGLLALHKTLIDSERVAYESAFGSIASPNAFLQLLLSDPWFAWLHPLSQLVVQMDEALDAEEPITPELSNRLVAQSADLLRPMENGVGFGKHYYEAIQREPDVIFAHADVMKLLGKH